MNRIRNTGFLGVLFLTIAVVLSSCGEGESDKSEKTENKPEPKPQVKVTYPEFNADSAYYFIEKQLSFGSRIPGTEAHAQAADWLVDKFSGYSTKSQVKIQNGRARLYNNKVIDLKNVIASINPDAKQRILLCAHWDSRMFADHDPSESKQDEPVPGANDGASGVAVLMEIARVIQSQPLNNLGIDIVLFDAEDQGTPDNKGFRKTAKTAETWALGAQYWARNPHRNPGRFRYGVLLDMVGAENATFPRETYSMDYAPHVVNKVWNAADRLGYGNYFIDEQTQYGITDDHYFINTIAQIPTIDIIHYNARTGSFFPQWHTVEDDIDIISKETLNAVGTTLLYTIYHQDAAL